MRAGVPGGSAVAEPACARPTLVRMPPSPTPAWGELVAVVTHGDDIALVGEGVSRHLPIPAAADWLRTELGPRRVLVWSAERDLTTLIRREVSLPRVLDLAQAYRIEHGGWRADPGRVWAGTHGLDVRGIPALAPDDLFSQLRQQPGPDDLTVADGHLRPDATDGDWLAGPGRLERWAQAAHACAAALYAQLAAIGPRALALAVSESAASVLCVELERDGLPLDRAHTEHLIALAAGPRPRDAAHEKEIRAARDAAVLSLAPGHEATDLRNPGSVKALLAGLGIAVETTRKWVLAGYRDAHPLVPALLAWRADERIETTYGYAWLDNHVGPDDRLRGAWSPCDGAAGRMTAQNGLHNLPAAMRPAVAAAPGWTFVRADLGQIEPRVLAVVSGDPTLAAATMADDLYAPIAARLQVERPIAKVAVLAAMYGQRSGTAGRALERLQRAYPRAMGFLDEAYAAGLARADLRTYGGRRIRTAGIPDEGSRGRYARNALIQGAAAELFKCWAATVRAELAGTPAHIALCLHDELLIHTPQDQAPDVCRVVATALTDAARRWSGDAPVRFVTDTMVVQRWSEAKD